MIIHQFPKIVRERRATVLSVIILIQALCTMFFVGDVIYDLSDNDHLGGLHLYFEVIAAFALFAGVVYLMYELRALLNRMEAMQFSILAARGEMTNLINAFFDEWRLTQSEREIALLILKGIDNDSIAKMRGTAKGTVRAQCTKIYAKANVDSRTQLLSIFMEELISIDKNSDV